MKENSNTPNIFIIWRVRCTLYSAYFLSSHVINKCPGCSWIVIICAGEFGTVFRGIWKESPKKQIAVAIKTLKVLYYLACSAVFYGLYL